MSNQLVDRGYYLEAQPGEIRVNPAVQFIGVNGKYTAPPTDRASLMRASRTNEVAWACIEVKRKAMQDPRLKVERQKSDGTWEEVKGHPLRRLMMRPMPGIDEAYFMGLAMASLDICGVFYAEKVYSKAGALVGLNPLNPVNVCKRMESGEHTGYIWQSGSKRHEFRLDELLVMNHPSWGNVAPLSVAMGSIEADTMQTDFIRSFFGNGGVPSGVLTTEQELSQEQADIIRARHRAIYGRSTQRDIMVLGKGTTYQQIGADLDDLDSESLRGFTESRICMVFNVPPLIVYAMIGLMQATYSNLKEAWSSFWDSELSSQLKAFRSFFTWALLLEFEDEELVFGERVRLEWDLSRVAALQDDVDAIHKRAESGLKAGAWQVNEYRSAVGLPLDPNGNYYLRSLAQQAVAPDQALPQLGDDETDPLATRTLPRRLPLNLRSAALLSVERRMEIAIRDYIVQEYEIAADVAADLV